MSEQIGTSALFDPEIHEIILRVARTGRISIRDLDKIISYVQYLRHQ